MAVWLFVNNFHLFNRIFVPFCTNNALTEPTCLVSHGTSTVNFYMSPSTVSFFVYDIAFLCWVSWRASERLVKFRPIDVWTKSDLGDVSACSCVSITISKTIFTKSSILSIVFKSGFCTFLSPTEFRPSHCGIRLQASFCVYSNFFSFLIPTKHGIWTLVVIYTNFVLA